MCINTLGIAESTSQPLPLTEPITIAPNPCSRAMRIILDLPVDGEPTSLYLYDVLGRLQDVIWQRNSRPPESFIYQPPADIASGVYYLVIDIADMRYKERAVLVR